MLSVVNVNIVSGVPFALYVTLTNHIALVIQGDRNVICFADSSRGVVIVECEVCDNE